MVTMMTTIPLASVLRDVISSILPTQTKLDLDLDISISTRVLPHAHFGSACVWTWTWHKDVDVWAVCVSDILVWV